MILYNGLTLAYIGDAYYELWIRNYLLKQGKTLVKDLHNSAVLFTQATSQALAAYALIDGTYTDEEKRIFKRGRNQSATHKPKNADVNTYNHSTGFEAVIGYLYLKEDFVRLETILENSVSIVEKNLEVIISKD
ncbi:MAG: ribonuclease III domain-containing protein [Candidatus Izemoplasmatales bacterium]